MSALEDSLRAVYKLEPRAMPNRGFLQAPQPMSEAEKLAQQAMQVRADVTPQEMTEMPEQPEFTPYDRDWETLYLA